MKTKTGLLILAFIIAMTNLSAQDIAETNSELLELPGDNLDLYATLDLFQKSKTIEEFEASLNNEKTGINNLDLNVDGDVDFIKVVTQKEEDHFTFVLQVDVLEKETQDVAVILVSKDSKGKVTLQMVGDKDLYGNDYVIEPKLEVSAVTANPAYSGSDTVVVQSQAAKVVVVESTPIVRYVYSPVYVPYYSPYYYGYYPIYYHPYPVISLNIYFGRNRHYHNHYHGRHRGGNTVVINNNKTYNNYSRNRNTSKTVNRNRNEGKYIRHNSSTRRTTNLKSNPSTKSSAIPHKKSVTKSRAKSSTKLNNKAASKRANRTNKRGKKRKN